MFECTAACLFKAFECFISLRYWHTFLKCASQRDDQQGEMFSLSKCVFLDLWVFVYNPTCFIALEHQQSLGVFNLKTLKWPWGGRAGKKTKSKMKDCPKTQVFSTKKTLPIKGRFWLWWRSCDPVTMFGCAAKPRCVTHTRTHTLAQLTDSDINSSLRAVALGMFWLQIAWNKPT